MNGGAGELDSAVDRPVRTGVVGLGYFGSFHVKHYMANPLATLVGVADASAKRGEAVREAHGVAAFVDHRQLIGRVDAVSIAAPTSLHHAIAADFIEAGVHVLVEKPVTDRADTARDLVARAARHGVVFQVGHIERFSPTFRDLARRVSAPTHLELVRHSPWTGRITDVDVVLDLMIHDIDLATALAASPVETVVASGAELMGHGLDVVTAMLTFSNGAIAQLSASRVAAAPRREIRVVDRGRSFTADLMSRKVSTFEPRIAADGSLPATSFVDVPAEDALGVEIGMFLGAIAHGRRGGVDGKAALDALVVAERIRKAARAAVVVHTPEALAV